MRIENSRRKGVDHLDVAPAPDETDGRVVRLGIGASGGLVVVDVLGAQGLDHQALSRAMGRARERADHRLGVGGATTWKGRPAWTVRDGRDGDVDRVDLIDAFGCMPDEDLLAELSSMLVPEKPPERRLRLRHLSVPLAVAMAVAFALGGMPIGPSLVIAGLVGLTAFLAAPRARALPPKEREARELHAKQEAEFRITVNRTILKHLPGENPLAHADTVFTMRTTIEHGEKH
jgi:hypothetical protein